VLTRCRKPTWLLDTHCTSSTDAPMLWILQWCTQRASHHPTHPPESVLIQHDWWLTFPPGPSPVPIQLVELGHVQPGRLTGHIRQQGRAVGQQGHLQAGKVVAMSWQLNQRPDCSRHSCRCCEGAGPLSHSETFNAAFMLSATSKCSDPENHRVLLDICTCTLTAHALGSTDASVLQTHPAHLHPLHRPLPSPSSPV
jgi:hypothetical protein